MLLRSFAMTACLALAACSSTSTGGDPFMATSATGTEGGQKEKKAAQLAQCAQPVGTVSLVEKEIPALEGTGLTSPTTVMRLMITQSNCFQIVDADHPARRGKRGAQADYFLTADVISKNENAGGVDGSVGRFLPGQFGQVASAVSVKIQESQVAIYLTNGKTGVQVAAATGKASTADAGFDFSRTTWGGGGGGGAYANTEIGKTITAAFADAYGNLVRQAQAQPQQVARAVPKKK
jgi:hypothetical protein